MEFVKAIGQLGYFAAGVTHVKKETTRREAVITPVMSFLVPVTAPPTEQEMALTSAGGSLRLQGDIDYSGGQTAHLPYSTVQ